MSPTRSVVHSRENTGSWKRIKSHRVVFRVDKLLKSVYVLYVRHSKRQAIGEDTAGAEDVEA